MSYDLDMARANLEQLASYYRLHIGNRNEATTRIHLIDTLLMECLGWAKYDIIAEEPYNEQYVDYALFAPRKSHDCRG